MWNDLSMIPVKFQSNISEQVASINVRRISPQKSYIDHFQCACEKCMIPVKFESTILKNVASMIYRCKYNLFTDSPTYWLIN